MKLSENYIVSSYVTVMKFQSSRFGFDVSFIIISGFIMFGFQFKSYFFWHLTNYQYYNNF